MCVLYSFSSRWPTFDKLHAWKKILVGDNMLLSLIYGCMSRVYHTPLTICVIAEDLAYITQAQVHVSYILQLAQKLLCQTKHSKVRETEFKIWRIELILYGFINFSFQHQEEAENEVSGKDFLQHWYTGNTEKSENITPNVGHIDIWFILAWYITITTMNLALPFHM